jgi:hypothetical protein
MRLASPPPGYCSVCFAGTDPKKRYVDFEVAFDGAPVLDPETKTIAVLPWDGMQSSHDDLFLCEDCVKAAAEKLAFRPQFHARQEQELKKARVEADHWRATAERYRAEADAQFGANIVENGQKPRRVKV